MEYGHAVARRWCYCRERDVGEGVRWWHSRCCRLPTHLGLVNVSVIGCDQETDKSQLCPKLNSSTIQMRLHYFPMRTPLQHGLNCFILPILVAWWSISGMYMYRHNNRSSIEVFHRALLVSLSISSDTYWEESPWLPAACCCVPATITQCSPAGGR
jgi:hypothetical protein